MSIETKLKEIVDIAFDVSEQELKARHNLPIKLNDEIKRSLVLDLVTIVEDHHAVNAKCESARIEPMKVSLHPVDEVSELANRLAEVFRTALQEDNYCGQEECPCERT